MNAHSPRLAAVAAATALALAAASPAAAVPCALDEPPAATLLLPYFEVALDGTLTTLLSVGNATVVGSLARVTLWSDLGVPVFWFDVYLTGWDVQTINLRDVLHGELPQTAPPAADPGDHLSPRGELSSDDDFPGCEETMPPANLPPPWVAHLRAALTGQPSPIEEGTCYGADHGDGVARGWVTVDAVLSCNSHPPGYESPILSSGPGLAPDNVLWGDFLIVDPVENRASAANLVRIEAAEEPFAEGARSFYGSRIGNIPDDREPLPTVWAARYLVSAISGGTETDLVYWRDPGESSHPFDCDTSLVDAFPWLPLEDDDLVVFDEEENPDIGSGCVLGTACPPEEHSHLPLHSGRVAVGGADLPVPFAFGWLYLDLDLESGPTQAWVGTLTQADGRYSAAVEATELDAPCSPGRSAPTDE